MKNKVTPEIYYNAITQYHILQLLFEAIKVDIFSYLDNPITVDDVVKQSGYDKRNTELLLRALSEHGYIEKEEKYYYNTKESAEYLSKNSSNYLGKTILFREDMTTVIGTSEKVIHGANKFEGTYYDFAVLAEVTVPEMYLSGRVDNFIHEIKEIYPDTSQKINMLDLGGGSGILAIEFAKTYKNSKAYVFEHPTVANITKKIISEHNMESRVNVLAGDFNTDNINGKYDFIVASGILDFASQDMDTFIDKITLAMLENAHFMVIGSYSESYDYPKGNIINWLSGYMGGITPPPTREDMETALGKEEIRFLREFKSGNFSGYLYRKEKIV